MTDVLPAYHVCFTPQEDCKSLRGRERERLFTPEEVEAVRKDLHKRCWRKLW